MTDILLGIDGTGPFLDDTYQKAMADSFVSAIYKHSGIPAGNKFYHRGPSVTGVESGFIGIGVFLNYLTKLRNANKAEPINLYITGYSRGAMIAVYAANRIHQFNLLNQFGSRVSNAVKRGFGYATDEPAVIRIKSMMLFDAVDSDVTMAGPGITTIPACVEEVHHFICKESSTLLPRSRWFFNRIDLECDSGKLHLQDFDCTHSAIGGLPGRGDYRTQATGKDILRSGAKALNGSLPIGLTNPAYAAGAFVAGSLSTAYDSIKSNITLEQDWKGYHKARKALFKIVDPGWKVSRIPECPRQ